MKNAGILTLLLLAMIGLSCTAQPQDVTNCVSGESAGFLLGLWHGCIAPIAFIISLFEDSITVFEVNNNGVKYLFGFLLGVGAFTSGTIFGTRKSKK